MLWIAKQSAAILACRYGLARVFPARQSERHSIKEQSDIKKEKKPCLYARWIRLLMAPTPVSEALRTPLV